MIWLTWRQFRAQGLIVLALLAAAAIAFLVTGVGMHHTYTADLAACTPQDNCDSTFREFQERYLPAFSLIQFLVLVTPALIGIFWGAPLLGRELETGTHQLAWNQTVTRTRWLAVKLTIVGIAAIATAGILSYLLTWWATPLDKINGDRWAAMTFATRDIVPLGYAAFAFALGTTLGLFLRRTLPAMAVTLAVFIFIQILVPAAIRPNLLPSTTVTFPIDQSIAAKVHGVEIRNGASEIYLAGLPIPQGAWVISSPPIEDSSGHVVAASSHLDCFPGLDSPPGSGLGQAVAKGGGPRIDQIGTCLAPFNLHETVTYQPASHYWPLQWIETGIFLVLGGALAGTCFWWIRRRQN
jgi:ABC-type transport system involved in multi-copper enzyme maturation permease subunit